MRSRPSSIGWPRTTRGTTLDVPGAPNVRGLITSGILVAAIAVYAVLASDGAAELIYLDFGGTWS
jgi:hypothetical protein